MSTTAQQPIEKFRAANIVRILYNLAFFGIFVYLDLRFIYPFSLLHLAFGVIWIVVIEREIIVERDTWWSAYFPATFDMAWITMLAYVTGNISSFVIIGYFISVALGSMTEDRNSGLYIVILGSVLYAVMGTLVLLGVIPPENIVMQATRPTLPGLALSVFVLSISLLVVNQVISRLFRSLNRELEARRVTEARLLRDLELARRVQQSIIPAGSRFPARAEFRFGSCYVALESVGGDLYDVIPLDEERFGFLIADVSGHGVSAALVTTMAKAAFTTAAAHCATPAMVCRQVNRDMHAFIGETRHYLTAYYCVIDLRRGQLQYCNAGHNPALLLRQSEVIELGSQETFLLGVEPEFEFLDGMVELRPLDRLLLLTDGILEAHNPLRALYADRAFGEFLARHQGLRLPEFVDALMESVVEFSEGVPPRDDRAVLCVDYLPEG